MSKLVLAACSAKASQGLMPFTMRPSPIAMVVSLPRTGLARPMLQSTKQCLLRTYAPYHVVPPPILLAALAGNQKDIEAGDVEHAHEDADHDTCHLDGP